MRHFINAAGTVATVKATGDHFRASAASWSVPFATETEAVVFLTDEADFREFSTAGGYAAM